MALSRKHFCAIAAALLREKPADHWDPNKRVQWELDCKAMASTLAQFNGMFDRGRFLRACGLDAP